MQRVAARRQPLDERQRTARLAEARRRLGQQPPDPARRAVVGELTLSYKRLDIPADHGLTLFTYAAEPGSRSEEGLKLLGSWAATVDRDEPARATDQR